MRFCAYKKITEFPSLFLSVSASLFWMVKPKQHVSKISLAAFKPISISCIWCVEILFYHHKSILICKNIISFPKQKNSSYYYFFSKICRQNCALPFEMISSFRCKSINLKAKQNNNKTVNKVIYSTIRMMLSLSYDYDKMCL